MAYRIALYMLLAAVVVPSCGDSGPQPKPDGPTPAPRGSAVHDWPMFRGSPAMTGIVRGELPAKLGVLWTHNAGAAVNSTAAIVGGRVYVGTDGGQLLCLDLADGTRKWAFKTSDGVSASPCVVDGRVYVGDEGGWFYAINAADGSKAWAVETGGKIISSATPVNGSVLVGSYDNSLYCFDAKTGEKQWAFEADSYVHCSPCVAGGDVVIAGCDGLVRMVDLATGGETAAAEFKGLNFAACAAYAGGHVYVGDMAGTYRAIRCKDAKVVWTFEDEDGGDCFAGAAVADDVVVFASRGPKVLCLGRATGEPRWTRTFKGGVDSSPVICGGRVYFGTSVGNVYALKLDDGSTVWSFAAGGAINASAAIGRNRLIIGNDDGTIYCFGAK